MKLFEPIVDEKKRHPNFVAGCLPAREPERALLNSWAEGFVDRDGKFVGEFQTTFNTSFWEIYLYACLKELGYSVDWSHAAPDFVVEGRGVRFVIEAVTANAAQGKPNEWDRTFSDEEIRNLWPIKPLNVEAMIRLSNAIISKTRKYEESYQQLEHVKAKPFVVAVAPFEQPHFNLQYDRPIRALLYDCYIDEDAFLKDPTAYQYGAPAVSLGSVTKANGSDVPLGIFNDASLRDVSAVVFSTTATWGKLTAMTKDPTASEVIVRSLWATPPNGAPLRRVCTASEHQESVLDGLQIYHNPHARYPLTAEAFRAPRVVQHFIDAATGNWIFENRTEALLIRNALRIRAR